MAEATPTVADSSGTEITTYSTRSRSGVAPSTTDPTSRLSRCSCICPPGREPCRVSRGGARSASPPPEPVPSMLGTGRVARHHPDRGGFTPAGRGPAAAPSKRWVASCAAHSAAVLWSSGARTSSSMVRRTSPTAAASPEATVESGTRCADRASAVSWSSRAITLGLATSQPPRRLSRVPASRDGARSRASASDSARAAVSEAVQSRRADRRRTMTMTPASAAARTASATSHGQRAVVSPFDVVSAVAGVGSALVGSSVVASSVAAPPGSVPVDLAASRRRHRRGG